jgi:hypothetical protein
MHISDHLRVIVLETTVASVSPRGTIGMLEREGGIEPDIPSEVL